jgi:hypothetical protein
MSLVRFHLNLQRTVEFLPLFLGLVKPPTGKFWNFFISPLTLCILGTPPAKSTPAHQVYPACLTCPVFKTKLGLKKFPSKNPQGHGVLSSSVFASPPFPHIIASPSEGRPWQSHRTPSYSLSFHVIASPSSIYPCHCESFRRKASSQRHDR